MAGLHSGRSNEELMESCYDTGFTARAQCAAGTTRAVVDTVLVYGFVLHVYNEAENEQFDVIESVQRFADMGPADLTEHLKDEANLEEFQQTVRQVRELIELTAQLGKVTYEVMQMAGPLLDFAEDANDFLTGLDGTLEDVNAGIAEANRGLDQMNSAMVEVNSGLSQMNAGIDQANAAMDQTNAGIKEANEGLEKLNSGASGMVSELGGLSDLIEGERSVPVDLSDLDLSGMDDVFGQRDLDSIFASAEQQRRMSLLLDLTPGVGDAKGVYESITGDNPVTGENVSGIDRALGGVVFLSTLRSSYKGADTLINMVRYREVMGATESSNEVIASLRATGELPSQYVTQAEAEAAGWVKGKALNNHVPGGQVGGDVFENRYQVVPSYPGRVWYEADVGLSNKMKRSKQPGTRLLYSSDGLLYVTADHYETSHFVGTYK
ncbi:hypothetical protein GCM10007079_28030 [Nocardiopsis terrae]|nr:hypothetical protein GCM10007079_28030 [Nocardiopsis terrae]